MKVAIFECRKSKRILVPILDFILFVMIALCFYVPLDLNMYDIGFNTFDVKQEICHKQVDSHLFKGTINEDDIIVKVDYLKYDKEDDDFYKSYVGDLYYYYHDYKPLEDKYFIYENINFNKDVLKFKEDGSHIIFNTIDLNSSPLDITLKDSFEDIYKLNEEKVITNKDKAYKDTVEKFFIGDGNSIYYEVLYDFAQNKDFNRLKDKLSVINLYQISISFGFSALIYFLLIPLCFKNGETLMMSLFKIGLITQNGYGIKKFHTVIRGTLYTLLIAFSFYLYFIPLILNVITLMATKFNRSMLDFASGTLVIDTHISKFYRRKEDDDGRDDENDDEE